MVGRENMTKQKSKNSKGIKLTKKKKKVRVSKTVMGPVSSISTAPVAIGNSVRGASCVSKQTPKGVVVMGRDFMFLQ